MMPHQKKGGLTFLVLLGIYLLGGCSISSNDPMQGTIEPVPFEELLAEENLENIKAELIQTGESLTFDTSEAITEGMESLEQMLTSGIDSTLNEMIETPKLPTDMGRTPNIANAGVMEVHFIDVGQGDCTLVINTDATGNKSCMLIDAGGNATGTKIQAYLQKQGIEYLDLFVVSHADEDHEGGADVIMTKFDIGTVLMPDMEKDTYTHRDVLDALEYKYMTSIEPSVGDVYNLGDASVTVIGPVAEYEDTNNSSICIKVEKGDSSFLFCGDAEEEAEQDMVNSGVELTADVYHVNHHGSNSSSTEEYLKIVKPEYAVISVGANNDYWHPHGSTLNTLRKLGILVYRTDEQGTIIASTDGNTITWNSAPSDTWLAGEGPKE